MARLGGGYIVAQGKLASNGPRLATEGKVLKPGGVITDGPFVEIKEKLGSFIIVKASPKIQRHGFTR